MNLKPVAIMAASWGGLMLSMSLMKNTKTTQRVVRSVKVSFPHSWPVLNGL